MELFLFGNGPKPEGASKEDVALFVQNLVPETLDNVSFDCRTKLESCQFPINDFIRVVLASRLECTKHIVVKGPTQIGKTCVKGLVHAAGTVAKVATIVLTKGNSERDELCDKMKRNAVDPHQVVMCTMKVDAIVDALKSGGSVVANQTEAQINRKLIRALEKSRQEDSTFSFIVILDEGDTMFRSREGEAPRVKVEQAYRDLLALKPLVVVMISATVLPMLLHLVDKQLANEKDFKKNNTKFFQLKPNEDYVSLELMAPMKDQDGKEIYLEGPVRYNKGEGIRMMKGGDMVPFSDLNGYMKLMYEQAVADTPSDGCSETSRRGVLLLDITDNRVYANGNVKDKAKLVQDGLFRALGKKIVVIVFVGEGIFVRNRPKARKFSKLEPGTKICDAINDVDDEFGLETPVFVFGFTKMNRGMSFRSDLRVPTHVIASRGMGYSHEDVIQTIGRGTFCGRKQLEANGFSKVTLLATWEDVVSARKYNNLTDHVSYRMECGDSLIDVLRGTNEKIPDQANPLRHAPRKIGQGPVKRAPCERIMEEHDLLDDSAFEAPTGADEYVKSLFWTDEEAQKLLGVLSRLWKKKPLPFELSDLQEAYSDDLRTNISQAKARPLLNQFYIRGILKRDKAVRMKSKEVFVWSIASETTLDGMLNPELSSFVY